MVDKKARDWQKTQKRKMEMRYVAGCTPPSWRRYIIAGATICYSIQALAQKSEHHPKEGDDDHGSTK